MTHRYTAAGDGWLAFITPARQLFVGAELEPAVVDRLWSRLRDERGPAGLLEALTANGLFATPPFAFVEAGDGDVSVIVRGDASVRAGAEQVSGAGATTWIERRMPGGSVGVTLGGRGGAELPIEAGVVRASAFATGAAAPPPPAPAQVTSDDFTPPPAPAVAPPAPVPTFEAPPAPPPAAPPRTDEVSEATVTGVPGEGYDYLFGDTMYRSVEDAAVRPESAEDDAASDAAEAPAEEEGDHDGSTVLASSITRTGRQRRQRGEKSAAPAPASVVVVLPGGSREVLDEPLVIGRSPSVAGVPADQLPRLVTITGGDQDISRSHVRVALEGGTVVVTDLHSRNGTSIVMPNGDAQKLRGGEPTPVMVGTRIDLGGGIELSVEEV
jgi:hypothetical protein